MKEISNQTKKRSEEFRIFNEKRIMIFHWMKKKEEEYKKEKKKKKKTNHNCQ